MLRLIGCVLGSLFLWGMASVSAFQEEPAEPRSPENRFAQRGGPPNGFDGPQGFDRGQFGGGFPGFGPGGPGGGERKLVKDFDQDNDGRLNAEERQEARKSLGENRRGGPGGFGPPNGFGGPRDRATGTPGPKVSPDEVESYPNADLYDLDVIRTLFLEFENEDWEQELADFKDTDVEVPATLTVDGKDYPHIGVHFRGMSSYGMIPAGLKRSLNLSLDFVDPEQKLYGYKTLNLLNCNGDPSMMNTVLYSHIARKHIAAPKANYVRVVINGESWGLYVNAQQFNKEFIEENYKSSKGERWKVPGRPGGDGGLTYVGENVEDYKRRYEIKSGDDEKAWKDLIALCRTLDQTPTEKLVEALEPILAIDEALWFLALDAALVNEDGYWTRASDYSLYQDKDGRFHLIPHDMNETFHAGGGPGGPGGFRGPGGFGEPGGRPGGRDFPGPFGGPGQAEGGFPFPEFPKPGEILPAPVRERLNLTEVQEKQIDELQQKTNEAIKAILTKEQQTQLNDLPVGGPFGRDRNQRGRGPGGPPGLGGGGVTLDPLVALNDAGKPLRSKLLAVPALRKKYLANVRAIAEESLNWQTLGPMVSRLRTLIQDDVKADTRKLSTYEAFLAITSEEVGDGGESRHLPLKSFAEKRREYLLKATEPEADAR